MATTWVTSLLIVLTGRRIITYLRFSSSKRLNAVSRSVILASAADTAAEAQVVAAGGGGNDTVWLFTDGARKVDGSRYDVGSR